MSRAPPIYMQFSAVDVEQVSEMEDGELVEIDEMMIEI
jgi:hypothetical protein